MRRVNRAAWAVLLLILLCGFLLVRSQRSLTRAAAAAGEMEKEGDLYLPEVSYLKFISLGHDGLMADLVLAKALTYYGSHYYERNTFPFKYIKKLFFTAVQLDPMNREAFLMANNILGSIDARDAVEILELGMSFHPDYWKFPEMIGFNYFYHLKDPRNAARYYELAAKLPGHPPYVPSLAGKFYRESGRYEDAVRVLYNFYSTTEDKRLKDSFKAYIEAVREQMRLKQFELKATVLKVVDPVAVEFQPDPLNPQYRFLKPVETLRLVGIRPYGIHSADEREKLFAYFQGEYARMMMEGVTVTLEFERYPDGRLKRDNRGRFQGFVIFRDNRSYQAHAVGAGMMELSRGYPLDDAWKKTLNEAETSAREKRLGIYGFPPEVVELKDIYKYVRRVVSVRFRVVKVEEDGGNIYLHSGSANRELFCVVIPLERVWDVDRFRSLSDRRVIVTGFAGLQDRQVRITLYMPIQLQVE